MKAQLPSLRVIAALVRVAQRDVRDRALAGL
jgi:hypothetical protein